jgi:hypothetical protein
MDLTGEAGRASPRHTNPALGNLPAITIADLAGTDTKIIFIARHQTMIGAERYYARPEMWSAWSSVGIAALAKIRPSPIYGTSQATALGALKGNDNRKNAPLVDLG